MVTATPGMIAGATLNKAPTLSAPTMILPSIAEQEFHLAAKTAVLSFNAGATANKLIVQVSAEGQEVDSITYQGVALTQAAAGTAS